MKVDRIDEIMEQWPCVLKANMTFSDALTLLADNEVNDAPVINEVNEYFGIFHLNSKVFHKNPKERIKSLVILNTPIISPKQSIIEIDIVDFTLPILPIIDNKKLIGVVSKDKFTEMNHKLFKNNINEITSKYEAIKNDFNEFQEILDHSYDGVAIANSNGVTERVNKAWDRITGLKREDIIGKPLKELVKKKYFSDSVSMKVFKSKKTVTIIQKMKSGKQALITGKPIFDKNGILSKVIMNLRDVTELYKLKETLEEKEKLAEGYHTEISQLRLKQTSEEMIIAESKSMRDLLYLASQVARVDSRIFLTGESGVGKGVVARFIHKSSHRDNHPFITVNCGAIPKDLLESELFGYVGGAFTGANPNGKMGMFELAEGGTLFLDEIAEIPLKSQVKLLSVLQEKKITRVGGTKSIKLDVRIIAATNQDLFQLVRSGNFREDLYYRLNVVPIAIPPLRDRREDIFPLAAYYLNLFNHKYNLNKGISNELMDQISNYDWPGNIRELENFIERIIVTSTNDILTSDYFPMVSKDNLNSIPNEVIDQSNLPTLKNAQNKMELHLITQALNKGKTQVEAARLLGISLSTLLRKMKKLNID